VENPEIVQLRRLVRSGKALATKRPLKGDFRHADSQVEVEAACRTWYMEAWTWIEQQFSRDSAEVRGFRALNKVRAWQNMLGTEFDEISFLREDLLMMIAYLEGLKSRVGPRSGAKPVDVQPPRLHPLVETVSRKLFENGHYDQAVFEAFKALNATVKGRFPELGLDGKALMARVFNAKNPLVHLTPCKTQSQTDEQEGFMLLFMGAMQGIRNPQAHEVGASTDANRAFEYLSLASLLLRRLDESTKDAPATARGRVV